MATSKKNWPVSESGEVEPTSGVTPQRPAGSKRKLWAIGTAVTAACVWIGSYGDFRGGIVSLLRDAGMALVWAADQLPDDAMPVGLPAPTPPTARLCKPGTIAVGALELPLTSPHPRPTWPGRAERESRVVQVESFCMDAAPVTVGDYTRCVEDGACPAPHNDCVLLTEAASSHYFADHDTRTYASRIMNCISHADAVLYCQARGGSLPTIAEIEAAAPFVTLQDQFGELAQDPFPPRVFKDYAAPRSSDIDTYMWRGSEPIHEKESGHRLTFSWNHARSTVQLSNLTFRCVFPVQLRPADGAR